MLLLITLSILLSTFPKSFIFKIFIAFDPKIVRHPMCLKIGLNTSHIHTTHTIQYTVPFKQMGFQYYPQQ